MKDYTPYTTHHAPASPVSSGFGDIRDQFTGTDEMRAATLSHMLHKAEAKIAILEATVAQYEKLHMLPLVEVLHALTQTEQPMMWVGELRCDAAPMKRVQASGDLFHVAKTLLEQYRVFSTQRIELNVNEEKKAS